MNPYIGPGDINSVQTSLVTSADDGIIYFAIRNSIKNEMKSAGLMNLVSMRTV